MLNLATFYAMGGPQREGEIWDVRLVHLSQEGASKSIKSVKDAFLEAIRARYGGELVEKVLGLRDIRKLTLRDSYEILIELEQKTKDMVEPPLLSLEDEGKIDAALVCLAFKREEGNSSFAPQLIRPNVGGAYVASEALQEARDKFIRGNEAHLKERNQVDACIADRLGFPAYGAERPHNRSIVPPLELPYRPSLFTSQSDLTSEDSDRMFYTLSSDDDGEGCDKDPQNVQFYPAPVRPVSSKKTSPRVPTNHQVQEV